MSVHSKMTALADEVRELSGSTDKFGIDEMTNTLNTENTNFNTNLTNQNDLIAQIQSALEGKASGGGGSVDQTIPFTIINLANSNIFECRAGLGMTLIEWSDSEYNTIGINVSSSSMFLYEDLHASSATTASLNKLGSTTIAPYMTYYLNI